MRKSKSPFAPIEAAVAAIRDGRLIIDTVAEQAGNQIIRNAEAELKL